MYQSVLFVKTKLIPPPTHTTHTKAWVWNRESLDYLLYAEAITTLEAHTIWTGKRRSYTLIIHGLGFKLFSS